MRSLLRCQINIAEMNRTWQTRGLDFAPSHSEPHLREDTPVVVVLHGLTGGKSLTCGLHWPFLTHCRDQTGSHESYVRAILAPTCTPRDQGGLGYRAVVVNFRGCEYLSFTDPNVLPPSMPHPTHSCCVQKLCCISPVEFMSVMTRV